jgi:NTP pyrophosphatase (non-canonical NTP hydrolase)
MNELQEKVFDWFITNFGSSKSEDELIVQQMVGMIEELGELSHSMLKLEQNIRKDEEHIVNLEDSIGDILVFALNLLSLLDIKIEDVKRKIKEGPMIIQNNLLFCVNINLQLSLMFEFILEDYDKMNKLNCISCNEATECTTAFNATIIDHMVIICEILQSISILYLKKDDIWKILEEVASNVLDRDWNEHRATNKNI